MRQAIVEIIGMLIQEVAPDEGEETDAKKKQKQINNFFGLLLERVLDLSPYVRAKVFNVFAKLVNVKNLRVPKQRLNITTAAVDALDDKSASVRKAAAALLGQLILTHPYGQPHGGYLQHDEWEAGYKNVLAELEKIEGGMGKVVETVNDEEGEPEDGEDGEEGQSLKSRKKSKK
jgi:condensin complex subunit 1